MKQNNNLIKITNTQTNEVRYFTKNNHVCSYIGCGLLTLGMIKQGRSKTYKHYVYEIVDGSEIKYKDINNVINNS